MLGAEFRECICNGDSKLYFGVLNVLAVGDGVIVVCHIFCSSLIFYIYYSIKIFLGELKLLVFKFEEWRCLGVMSGASGKNGAGAGA